MIPGSPIPISEDEHAHEDKGLLHFGQQAFQKQRGQQS